MTCSCLSQASPNPIGATKPQTHQSAVVTGEGWWAAKQLRRVGGHIIVALLSRGDTHCNVPLSLFSLAAERSFLERLTVATVRPALWLNLVRQSCKPSRGSKTQVILHDLFVPLAGLTKSISSRKSQKKEGLTPSASCLPGAAAEISNAMFGSWNAAQG